MHGEQALGDEAAAAQRAGVGPRAAVVPLVDDERGALAERLAAVRAHVRLLARVHALVQRQVALLHEPLAARPATAAPTNRPVSPSSRKPVYLPVSNTTRLKLIATRIRNRSVARSLKTGP